MLDLIKYGKNPFDSDEFGIADLVAFTTDHNGKMIKNNPGGKFTQRIADTDAALDTVDKAFADETTGRMIRKARKHSKDVFREHLWETITKVYAAVQAKYGADSAELIECFGEGRGIFQKVRDDLLAEKLASLNTSLLGHQPDLADPLALVNDLQSTWTALYVASEESSAKAGLAGRDRRAARKALAVELFKNLLTIALTFPEDPQQIAAYMQQSFLTHPRQPEEPVQPTPAPAPTPA